MNYSLVEKKKKNSKIKKNSKRNKTDIFFSDLRTSSIYTIMNIMIIDIQMLNISFKTLRLTYCSNKDNLRTSASSLSIGSASVDLDNSIANCS